MIMLRTSRPKLLACRQSNPSFPGYDGTDQSVKLKTPSGERIKPVVKPSKLFPRQNHELKNPLVALY